MRLFEEYFQRHGINVPVAHHCNAGALILRTNDASLWKNRWLLVTINWEDHPHHPGQYVIRMNSPVHDGYSKASIFTKWPPVFKKWHEYEDFFLEWSARLKGATPVTGTKEVTLAAWEMFVFAYDSWFLRQPPEVKRSLFDSLDKDNSLEARYIAYQDVAVFLATHQPAVLRTWKYDVLGSVQYYSDWLARLIENSCKEISLPTSKLETS